MKTDGSATPVLALVGGLVTEVDPHAAAPTATLDSTFEKLGIGSLELAQLFLRIQSTFGVAVPEHPLADAETLRDLVGVIGVDGRAATGRVTPHRKAWRPRRSPPRAGCRRRGPDPQRRARLACRRHTGPAAPAHPDHSRRTAGILASARAAMLLTVPEAVTLSPCCAPTSTACAMWSCPKHLRAQAKTP